MDYRLLEQLLGLSRIRVNQVQQTEDEILIWVSIRPGQHRCPRCGRCFDKISEFTEMKVRDLSVFGKTCYLIIRKGRLHCPCSFRGYEDIEFVDEHQRQTNRFNEFLFALCDRMTIADSSELMNVDWKCAYRLDQKILTRLKEQTALPELSAIGVDEISFEKYHKYFTVVYDLAHDHGVLFVAEGRSADSLSAFFESLAPEQRKKIQVVCTDTWDPYIKSIRTHVPHAVIVFDRFHLKKQLNHCIDQLRRSMVAQASKEQKKILKNKRWVLLKNQNHHTQKDKQSLEELKIFNKPLYEAYLVKEQFELFYHCANAAEGKKFFRTWIKQIPETIREFFQPFCEMLQRYVYGILSFFQYHYTNSIAEGINNKIKVLKRMAYGYRDKEYFKLKILRKCGYLKNIQPTF